jgi:hypothetical protein
MEAQFLCTDCGSEHAEPADARLGHLVICLDCTIESELLIHEDALVIVARPIAA